MQQRHMTLVLATLAVLGSVLVAVVAILTSTTLTGGGSAVHGDPIAYQRIAAAILDGAVPYVDIPVEHLPGALLPMLLIEWITRATGQDFTVLWAALMGAAFIISVQLASRFRTEFNSEYRFLLHSLPLLPLVLFRIEPWLMVWVVASMAHAYDRNWSKNTASSAIATSIKGWPIVLYSLPLRLGRRRLAAVAGLVTLVVLALIMLLPGFQEGRAFVGIHSETVLGSVLILLRTTTGADPQLVQSAGAVYVNTGAWTVILNGLVGLPFIIVGLWAISKTTVPYRLVTAIGLAVLGLLLASPLFSTQFVFWLVPFIIFLGTRQRGLFLAASLMSLAVIVLWKPYGQLWPMIVVARNLLLLALAMMWAYSTVTLTRYRKSVAGVGRNNTSVDAG